MEPSPLKQYGYKYGYSVFKPLSDINVISVDSITSDLNTDTVHHNTELEIWKELKQVDPLSKSNIKLLVV